MKIHVLNSFIILFLTFSFPFWPNINILEKAESGSDDGKTFAQEIEPEDYEKSSESKDETKPCLCAQIIMKQPKPCPSPCNDAEEKKSFTESVEKCLGGCTKEWDEQLSDKISQNEEPKKIISESPIKSVADFMFDREEKNTIYQSKLPDAQGWNDARHGGLSSSFHVAKAWM